MPADAQFIEEWIQDQGPWLYHGITPRVKSDKDRAALIMLDKILEEGLKPNLRPFSEKPWPTRELFPESHQFEDELDDVFHCPRPDHVYLTSDQDLCYGFIGVRIDLRLLDPANLSPDEDYWRDRGDALPGMSTWPVWPIGNPSVDKTLGVQAEEQGLGDNPEDTHRCLQDHGVLAYRGTIDPALIHPVPWIDENAVKRFAEARQSLSELNVHASKDKVLACR